MRTTFATIIGRRGRGFRAVLIAALLVGHATAPARPLGPQVFEVPFEFDHDAIVVRVMVDGRGPFDMLLDTGVDPSVVDLRTARALGLAVATAGHPGSGGGSDSHSAYETLLPRVRVGGVTQARVAALATDLAAIGDALGRPIAGVLGYSFLAGRVLAIDYPRRVVRFLPRSPVGDVAGPSRAVLPFVYRDDILARGVTVDGRPVVANVDTGSNNDFQLSPAAVSRLGLASAADAAPPTRSTGFNGASDHRRGPVSSIALGGIAIDRPDIVFLAAGSGHDDERWDLRIGNAFLKDYVVTIDYRRRVVAIERP